MGNCANCSKPKSRPKQASSKQHQPTTPVNLKPEQNLSNIDCKRLNQNRAPQNAFQSSQADYKSESQNEKLNLSIQSSRREREQNISQYSCLVHFDNDCLTKCLINKENIYQCGTNAHEKQYLCTISEEFLKPVRCPVCRSNLLTPISKVEYEILAKAFLQCYVCKQTINRENLCQHLIERVNPTCQIYPKDNYATYLMICPLIQQINQDKVQDLLQKNQDEAVKKEILAILAQQKLSGDKVDIQIQRQGLLKLQEGGTYSGFTISIMGCSILFQCQNLQNAQIQEEKNSQIQQQHNFINMLLSVLLERSDESISQEGSEINQAQHPQENMPHSESVSSEESKADQDVSEASNSQPRSQPEGSEEAKQNQLPQMYAYGSGQQQQRQPNTYPIQEASHESSIVSEEAKQDQQQQNPEIHSYVSVDQAVNQQQAPENVPGLREFDVLLRIRQLLQQIQHQESQ